MLSRPCIRFLCSVGRRTPRLVRCCGLSKKRSYYNVLGVASTATTEEIRSAYRSLAKTLHPDVSQEDDSEEVFSEINQAYAVLSDSEERGKYDYLWKYEQELQAAGRGEGAASLNPDEVERRAALEQLEAAYRQAERARRLATQARRASERAKKEAAAQVREARLQAAATAASATAAAATDRDSTLSQGPQPQAGRSANEAATKPSATKRAAAAAAATDAAGGGASTRSAPGDPGAGASAGLGAGTAAAATVTAAAGRPVNRAEVRRQAREAAQAAKRKAREARRHASQVRYWAQWAEQEAEEARRAAGIPTLESSPELLWEWQQKQKQQQGQQQQQGRRRDSGPQAWEPPE